jgi:UDP-N-acetylmuramoyl-tripeptide--D-alanyl-D-alanine ligase
VFDPEEIAEAVGGRYVPLNHRAPKRLRGVVTDSRGSVRGRLFVALTGERFDGHRFVADAFADGAGCAMVSDPGLLLVMPCRPFILVEDTLAALQKMAAWHRGRMKKLKVVAVTGSNGKTTVKEMIAAAVAKTFPTLVTQGNLNNHIGLPLTLLGLTEKHRVAVVEMGMSHPGEIALLADIARPDVAVVTNVGAAHLGHFSSIKRIAQAKGELVAGLGEKGIALLNGGDANSASIIERWRGKRKIVTFGRAADADYPVVDSWREPEKPGRTVAVGDGNGETILTVGLLGAHQVDNAAAAYAAARLLGVPAAAAVKGIARVKAPAMRMELTRLPGGALFVNDAYNANPDSTMAALAAVAELSDEGRAVVCLGEMRELGTKSEKAHAAVGREAARLGYALVVGVGDAVAPALAEAKKRGVETFAAATHAEAARYLSTRLGSADRLLLKGSRGARMEAVAAALIERMGKR